MTDISEEEEEFLKAVFAKAQYLKYLKDQDEIVKENCRKIRKRNAIMIISMLSALMLVIFTVKAAYMNTVAMLLLCISILSLGSCYEYLEENVKHETYNK